MVTLMHSLPPFSFLAISFGLTLMALGFAVKVFPRWSLLDFPERYGLKRRRLPYPAGIVGVIVFLILFSLTQPLGMQQAGVLLSVALLGLVSFVDDRTPLPAWMRVALQILVCFLLFATGSRIYTITNPFDMFGGADVLSLDLVDIPTALFGPLPLWSGIFTVVWLGLTMNALNWSDGIAGQVSILSVIGFLLLFLLAVSPRVGQQDLANIALLLLGISAAFLLFDFPPPKVILGDSGAMFLGLMLGLLGIYQGGKVATAFLVLGLPLCDAMFVGLRRMMKGKSPLRGNDKDHLHDLLLKKGWSQRRIIAATGLFGATFGSLALFLDTTGKALAGIALAVLVLGFRMYATTK